MDYFTDFDKLLTELQKLPVDSKRLVSKQPSAKTVRLFEFLHSIYGKQILSGQQYLQSEEHEDDIYLSVTGTRPAVRGYDLMDMDKGQHGDNQLARAVEWGKKGAIITFCWHWYAPDDLSDLKKTWSFYYKTTSYNHKTSFDLLKAVQRGTREYDFVVSRIDKAAEMLRVLEKEDIPVLWRPLHEACGDWFWWGVRKGEDREESAEAYKKLWYMIFDRFENYHKLTNLIWVWNGMSNGTLVNPNTFDIVGDDSYPEKGTHPSYLNDFNYLKTLASGKLLTLSECGAIPEVSALKSDKVPWLWWLPWWGEFVYDRKAPNRGINEQYMTEEFLKRAFADDYVINENRLPEFLKQGALL